MSSATIFLQLADSVLRPFVVAVLNEIASPANDNPRVDGKLFDPIGVVTAVGKQH